MRRATPMRLSLVWALCLFIPLLSLNAAAPTPATADVAGLISELRAKADRLSGTPGMRDGFQRFTISHQLHADSISYADFVVVRLLFEATRDAGFWNVHWTITNQPPNSDNIWREWQQLQDVSARKPTASAECDELSALYAFLAEREGIRGVGLFWPFPNHTVAVWSVKPRGGETIRVVVPTSQIFLESTDMFDTRKFNPWTQKNIYDYTRRDVPDAFEVPRPLFDFFLAQIDRYAGATDETLQEIRYLREGVFLQQWSAKEAGQRALTRRTILGAAVTPEDSAAYWNFAEDMGTAQR